MINYQPKEDAKVHNRLVTEIWTNARDKFTSSGRWHPVTMSEEKKEGNTYSFRASLFPLTPGRFEFTYRAYIATDQLPEYVWSGVSDVNLTVTVLPCPLNAKNFPFKSGVTREMIRWFESAVEQNDNSLFTADIKDKRSSLNMIAYSAALLGATALNLNVEPDYCEALVCLLKNCKFLSSTSNTKRLLVWSLGSSFLASSFQDSIASYWRDSTPTNSENNLNSSIPIHKKFVGALQTLLHIATLSSKNEEINPIPSIALPPITPPVYSSTLGTKEYGCSSILLELLLDVSKSCNSELLIDKFINQCIYTLIQSRDSIVHLYLPRVIRTIYDRPPMIGDNKIPMHISTCVVGAITNGLSMHRIWLSEYEKETIDKEIDNIYIDSNVSPLTSLLKLITNIIEHSPRCSSTPKASSEFNTPTATSSTNFKSISDTPFFFNQGNFDEEYPIPKSDENESVGPLNFPALKKSKSQLDLGMKSSEYMKQETDVVSEEQQQLAVEAHQNNLVLLAKGLTRLILEMPITHPDCKRVFEVVEYICRYSSKSLELFFKKILVTWPKDSQKVGNVLKLLFSLLTELEYHKDIDSKLIKKILKIRIIDLMMIESENNAMLILDFVRPKLKSIFYWILDNYSLRSELLPYVQKKLAENSRHWSVRVRELNNIVRKDLES